MGSSQSACGYKNIWSSEGTLIELVKQANPRLGTFTLNGVTLAYSEM